MSMLLKMKSPEPVQLGPETVKTSAGPLSDLIALINEVGAMQDTAQAKLKRIKKLQAELKPFTEKVKQLAELATKHAEDLSLHADKECTEFSDEFMLQIGKKGTERKVVNLEGVMKAMGKKVFFEKATIGLAVIDRYLTPEEKAPLLAVERTVRSIKVVRRSTVASR